MLMMYGRGVFYTEPHHLLSLPTHAMERDLQHGIYVNYLQYVMRLLRPPLNLTSIHSVTQSSLECSHSPNYISFINTLVAPSTELISQVMAPQEPEALDCGV